MPTTSYPPGPKGKPLFGHLFPFRRDPIGFLMDIARDYGDIVHFKVGPQNVFLFNHPNYIKDVLVTNSRNFVKSRGLERTKFLLGQGLLTSEGEFHHRQRRLIQPAFHRQRIAAYAFIMTDYGVRMRERWQDSTTVDIAQEMKRLTLSIAGKTLFNADVESESNEIGEALTVAMDEWRTRVLPFFEIFDRFPLPGNRRLWKVRERLDKTVYRIINEHRTSGMDQGDLLSMLLYAQDEESDGDQMTDTQLRDEALTILLAGHETAANALTWVWYLLSEYPDVESKLQAEIDSVLVGRLPTFNDVLCLRYTEMVFAEAMRLYPPAWILGRRAIGDYKVADYLLPAGSVIFMSPYVMHRDPRYFPDPLTFDPKRWTPELRALRPRFSYFPFGGGPRQCIGEAFAWMEGVLIIATIAQKWQMRLVPGHPVELQPLVTLRPKYGMIMTLDQRKSVPKC
ncbi:MAG: cytochrome P450 [Candidatus Dadabacteria bacterium]